MTSREEESRDAIRKNRDWKMEIMIGRRNRDLRMKIMV